MLRLGKRLFCSEVQAVVAKVSPLKKVELEYFRRKNDDDEIDWKAAMEATESSLGPPKRFDVRKLQEELPVANPTQTLAPIVKHNKALQKLVDLGVGLFEWETDNNIHVALRMHDFQRDVQPWLDLLLSNGVKREKLKYILTNHPEIFEQDLESLNTRIEYLESKKFSRDMVSKILNDEMSSWICLSVEEIDSRLGYVQKLFDLNGNQIRQVATDFPPLITWIGNPTQLVLNRFTVKEEMGFESSELKALILKCPEIFVSRHEEKLRNQFQVIHNEIGYPHEVLLKFPESLIFDSIETRSRHRFLEFIGRNQYDPKLPNYVSPKAITVESDKTFCEKTAKIREEIYDKFLRTL